MTAKEIAWALATYQDSPFHVRKQLAVVPNVSWGLIAWEADLIVCSKSMFLTEIEIKVSMSDWKADFDKDKWKPDFSSAHPTDLVKRFYYALPKELAVRHEELVLPAGSGVISMGERSRITVLKEALTRPGSRKLSDHELTKLLRLAAIKAWRMAYNPELDDLIEETQDEPVPG